MSIERSKAAPFFSEQPFNPKDKAVEGLEFRVGEITRTISQIKKNIGSSSRISRLLSKIGIGPQAKEMRCLKNESKQLEKMLTILGQKRGSDDALKLAPSDTLENLQSQLATKKTEKTAITTTISQVEKAITHLEKPYHDAVVFQAISESGLGDVASSDQETITLMDKLKAQACGLKYGLSKVEADIAALTDRVTQLEVPATFLAGIQQSSSSHNMLDFVETNRIKSFSCLNEIRDGTLKNEQLDAQRQALLQAINTKLSSLDGTPMPATVSCEQLRNTKNRDLPKLEGVDRNLRANIQKWHQTIPDFDACRNTLGRRDLTVVRLAGDALANPQIDDQSVLAVARVAHVCDMLEQQIKTKWPNANEEQVIQLVSDTVTLMAIDFNYTSVLTDLSIGIRSRLLTDDESSRNRRIVPGASTDPEYELILGDGDTPSCTVACHKNFRDLEGDSEGEIVHGEFTLSSTFTRAIDESEFKGSVSIAKTNE